MTVSELIELLKEQDPEAQVHITYNYGDHWRTTVAPTVKRVENGYVMDSEYHNMPKVIEDEEFDDNQDKCEDVVLLTS